MVDVPWKRGAIRSTHLPWRQANVNMLSLRPMRLSNRTGNGGLYTTGQGPFQEERLTDHGYTKLFNAMSVSETAGHVCSPDDRVVSHTVVMVRRKDAFSPFHAHEGLLAVWNTYLALDLDPCETGILISDHLHDSERMGPFLEFHRRVFAPVHGVERVLEVSARQISTCYRRLIVAIDPAYCFEIPYLHEDRIKGNCGRSPWLIGFGRHVLASFGIPRGAHAERQIPHVTLPMRITYKREVGGHTGLLETMRVMENRVAFGGAIKRMCGTDDSRKYSTNETSSARCTASQKDFATLPMAKQIALASSTDVMVGTHGASFTFMIYMPPHGVIVEVETKTDWHFFNMARYLGLSHRRIGQRIDHTHRRTCSTCAKPSKVWPRRSTMLRRTCAVGRFLTPHRPLCLHGQSMGSARGQRQNLNRQACDQGSREPEHHPQPGISSRQRETRPTLSVSASGRSASRRILHSTWKLNYKIRLNTSSTTSTCRRTKRKWTSRLDHDFNFCRHFPTGRLRDRDCLGVFTASGRRRDFNQVKAERHWRLELRLGLMGTFSSGVLLFPTRARAELVLLSLLTDGSSGG